MSGGAGESEGGRNLHGPGRGSGNGGRNGPHTPTQAPDLKGEKRPPDLRKHLFCWAVLRYNKRSSRPPLRGPFFPSGGSST